MATDIKEFTTNVGEYLRKHLREQDLKNKQLDLFKDMKTDPKPEQDKVNHPKHYTSHPSGVECIEVTQHYNFCIGNAIKYLWRADIKNEVGYNAIAKEIEDLEKAIWYINKHISNIKSGVYEQG